MSINFIFCLVGRDLIYVQWTASIYELLALWLQVMFLKQNWIIDKNAISTVLYILLLYFYKFSHYIYLSVSEIKKE